MNDLKLTYENLKSLMRKFKAQSDKKKKLEELTQRVKENNKTLQQLLYSHEAKL